MTTSNEALPGLRVNVDDVVYMPSLEAPHEKPHPFVYFLSIHNGSEKAVKILARKWIVKEAGGEVTVVEGEGVVGQQPLISPNEHFSYNSYHVVAKSAQVGGAFFYEIEGGLRGVIAVPEFELKVPSKK